jgi:outer membrane biosynthesis protein TonB
MDEESGGKRVLALLVVISVAAHAAMFATLGRADASARGGRKRRPAQVTMEVSPPRPAPPPPQPADKPPPPPRPVARRLAGRTAAPAEAPPPPPAAAPPPESPADFSGVTLTNDGAGPGWASAVGNGASMHGPIGRPGARVTARTVEGTPPEGPPLVELASLSRPPAPPDLAGELERHYPETARRQGLAGQAVLKARITPEGRARDLILISQSTPGFGDACRATLRESIWSAPLDRDGRAVATLVTYTCRFEVR